VSNLTELHGTDRDDFVLLLTDGLPNCNANNPNAGNTATCRCTQTSCGTSPLGCLDKDASVAAVAALQSQREIRTIVIGFGAETAAGAGPETLNAMAEAGGFARNCEGDPLACGAGDTCDPATKLCGRRFYQAANADELAAALREIINKIGDTNPCLLALDRAQLPSSSSLIIVYVNDKPVASDSTNTWRLDIYDPEHLNPNNSQDPDNDEFTGIKFVGETCNRILSSTNANPIKLEVRAVQRK
jgi:hypothetical protein